MSAKHLTMKVGIYVIERFCADIVRIYIRHVSDSDICPGMYVRHISFFGFQLRVFFDLDRVGAIATKVLQSGSNKGVRYLLIYKKWHCSSKNQLNSYGILR